MVTQLQLNSIIIPIVHRDLPELFDLFSIFTRPFLEKRRINLVVSFDMNMSDADRISIEAHFRKNKLSDYFDMKLIDCALLEEESFYLRSMPEDFDHAKHPYGLKSGPNIQFFRSLRKGADLAGRHGAVLILETDMTPLNAGWLGEIEAEINAIGEFVVAGSVFKGRSILPPEIRGHINGASVYNWSHPEFDQYLAEWENVLKIGCTVAPWHAYDVMPEWLAFNVKRFPRSEQALTKFIGDYRRLGKWIQTIENQSGPFERRNPDSLAINSFSGRSSLVHLRVPAEYRLRWQEMRARFRRNDAIGELAVDREWQYPAITELHAFNQMRVILSSSSSTVYFGFPWATLIDQILHNPEVVDILKADLSAKIEQLKRYEKVVTVCQHIHLEKIIDLMREAGITDVFWSHATHEDVASEKPVRIYPFPLYPVQVAQEVVFTPVNIDKERKYLFSFVGSYSPRYYLSQSRNQIVEYLSKHPRGYIVERKQWHYDKIVYKHQIKKQAGEKETLIDDAKSEEFRESLLNATFSLCPSGSGPNSIRLWEAIGAGSIPVILADSWAPPGNSALWENAVIFCEETPENIKALPDKLAAIAAEPRQLVKMRHALRQLWLLYGSISFVTDVQQFLLTQDTELQVSPSGRDILARIAVHKGDARLLLITLASALLLSSREALYILESDVALSRSVVEARSEVGLNSELGLHFVAVLEHAQKSTVSPQSKALASTRESVPKVCLFGRHSHRTPLSYASVRSLIGERLRWTDDLASADLIVTGFNIDLKENAEILAPLIDSARKPKVVVISEEPLWDITWSGPFTGRVGQVDSNGKVIPYTFLSHETSEIFAFDRIPYFVLTNDSYVVRYANLLAGYAMTNPTTMLKRWQAAPIGAAFFAEYRKSDNYSRAYPERDVFGLSTYRTEVAERVNINGVLRVGRHWGNNIRRQDLPDWHLDKLAQLSGQARVVSSYENVHHHSYISEKIFDAFSVGAIPTYWGSPRHRIWELVPEAAILNTFGLDSTEAAERIAAFEPDTNYAEAWLTTCARLRMLFNDFDLIRSERQRVAQAVLNEVLSIV